MRKKELEKRLTAQGLALMPEINIAEIERTAFFEAQNKAKAKKKGFKPVYAIATLLVLVFLGATVFSAFYLFTPETEIYFEVNPSFKLSVTPLNKVKEFVALNGDAQNIFDLSRIENQSVDDAGDYIFDTLYSLGYIKEDVNMEIKTEGKNNKNAEKLMNKVKTKAEKFMKVKNVKGKVNGKVENKGKNKNKNNRGNNP